MIDQLCQAYHWSWEDTMRRTMPQIIILNHAAWVNGKRSEERSERKRQQEAAEVEAKRKQEEEDPVVWRGKRLSQLNSDEMLAYYGDWSAT